MVTDGERTPFLRVLCRKNINRIYSGSGAIDYEDHGLNRLAALRGRKVQEM